MLRYRLSLILLLIGTCCQCTYWGTAAHQPTRSSTALNTSAPINRYQWVNRHNPSLKTLDTQSPFTLGNGHFAVTADITGLQSLSDDYFQRGIPLETKARWAWHTQANPNNYTLSDASEAYSAYGETLAFPTRMDTAAGQWLRQNPHDLPLARIGFLFNQQPLKPTQVDAISQQLNLWRGELNSQFNLNQQIVQVTSLVEDTHDRFAAQIKSPLLLNAQLSVAIEFPRGYDTATKNTPVIIWHDEKAHSTQIIAQDLQHLVLKRTIDDSQVYVAIRWQGTAAIERVSSHNFRLTSAQNELNFSVEFVQDPLKLSSEFNFAAIKTNTAAHWEDFWRSGAAVDFSGSRDKDAFELERRIVLSRYLMAVQERADIPPQETGLTSSSWYGKFHTEMAFWHSAHWILWGQPNETKKLLNWYRAQLPKAQQLAQARHLDGARWAKMVGPDNRESPGGNPLIIWNQPQAIHLAELLFQYTQDVGLLNEYGELVEETAAAMASMLSWDNKLKRYNLAPPIWIAQEIYEPKLAQNPTFELAYWRTGLTLAQQWRKRRGLSINSDWQKKLEALAPLPIKNNRYVAIESIPDTFENPASRRDHPSMLAAFGLLNDSSVDKTIMANTLDSVINTWDWGEKIWGWDYPMMAMTAARLNKPDLAVHLLMQEGTHNRYLPNGHVPQAGAQLPVYLPANGALLAAVAMMLGGWEAAPAHQYPGFPQDWVIRAEGFSQF